MNKDLKDQDVLLVKEKNSDEVKVVKGIDAENKKLETVKPNLENQADFMKLDKNGNILDNFFENFNRQFKNPTDFVFFKIPAAEIEKVAKDFAQLEKYKIEPPGPQKEYGISADSVSWKKFEELGINKKYLEYKGGNDKFSNLDKLLNNQKTDLVPVSLEITGQKLPTSARISLRKEPDGTYSPKLHLIKHKPELEKPYFGVKFTDEDKKNLLSTGNLGRIVEAEFKPGEKTSVLISLDKQTNDLVAFRKEWLKVPDTYKGVTLNEEQKQQLGEGKKVLVEGMTSQQGTTFSREVQFNADKRIFELIFDKDKKQTQNQQQNNEQKEIPKTFRKKELTEDQRSGLNEGITVYIDGLIDKNNKPYAGYITFDKDTGKLDFMFSKAYKEALAAGKVTPDSRHKTQVAVNSEGKTNEATKNVKEPMDKGQTQPKEHQAEDKDKKKPKRIKM
jgi:hypothetical protein